MKNVEQYAPQFFPVKNLFPSTPGNEVPGAIAYVDPNFKMPQVWRSNVNAEFQLPYGFMLSVGAMYTRDIYNVVQKNMARPYQRDHQQTGP